MAIKMKPSDLLISLWESAKISLRPLRRAIVFCFLVFHPKDNCVSYQKSTAKIDESYSLFSIQILTNFEVL